MIVANKSNLGLVEHAKMSLKSKWGYVRGTFGNVLTEKLLQEKLAQLPCDEIKPYLDFIEKNYIGRRTADCVGLIKSYMWWDGANPVYDSKTDKSADGMYAAATEKGSIWTMPDIPGICVYKSGHIGVYIGNGQVIEAHGTKSGVIQTPLKGSSATAWTHWLKCPYIEYAKEDEDMGKTFKDVDDNRWSAKYIEAAKNLGIVSGNPDGTFNPEGPLTREQGAVIVTRLYEKVTGKTIVS